MRIWGMRPGVTIALNAADRRRLEAILGNRNAPQKHAWRAEIVLLSAGGLGTVEIMRRTGKSKTCVWRWQERFAEAGVAGLLRDKTRPPRIAPLAQEVIDKVVALTATEPLHEASHWTGAAMAKAAGISVSSVQRIWKAHGLETAPRPPLQALHRPRVRAEAHCRALRRPADPCRGALGRREEPCVDGPRLASEKLMV
jgi:transposase